LESLTTPRSPAQYTGSFEETVLTTTTNPPQSHYKASYYIYAGEDQGVTYQVYLKGSSSSYYQDSSSTYLIPGASGYLPAGEYFVDTPDFTAPSGYNTMCISVNGEVECGFDQSVSTSFAENYLADKYLEEQATEQVTSESDCTSGTASLYSLINPNLQSVVEDLTDTDLYADGITRVCATENPGMESDANWNTEDARWKDVGYCGDNDLRCWIDTDTVRDAIRTLNIEESALEDNADSYLERLVETGNYISTANYSKSVSKIKSESDFEKKVELVNEIIDKVFYSNQKAELFLLRGQAYKVLALRNLISERDVVSYDSEVSDLDLGSIYTYSDGIQTVYYAYSSDMKQWVWSLDKETWNDYVPEIGEEVSSLNRNLIDGLINGNLDEEEGVEFLESEIGCSQDQLSESIISVAKGKIGEDTTRWYADEEVYDNVCSTFVSNVLIDAGLLAEFNSCSLETTLYRDSIRYDLIPLLQNNGFEEIEESSWNEGLIPGDVVVWGCNGLSFCSAKSDATEYQHVTIFESYEGTGVRIIHDGGRGSEANGAGRDVESKVYTNPFGDNWYITHVYRATCSGFSGNLIDIEENEGGTITDSETTILESSSPLFAVSFNEVSFGQLNGKRLEFVYSDGWYWRVSETSTVSYASPSTRPVSISSESKWVEADLDEIEDDYYKKDVYDSLGEQKSFVDKIEGSSYSAGLNILISLVELENVRLRTENVYYPVSSENDYFFFEDEGRIYFDYSENDGWSFKALDLDRDVDWIKVDEFSFEKETNSRYVIKEEGVTKYRGDIEMEGFDALVSGLNGEDFESGAVYLFSKNYGYGEIEVYSSEKFSTNNVPAIIQYLKDKRLEDESVSISIVTRELYDLGILSSGEFNFISGDDENNLADFPEDLDYLIAFLELKENLKSVCTDVGSIDCYIDYVDRLGDTERYSTYTENRVFTDYVYVYEFLSEEQYKEMLPTRFGSALYSFGSLFVKDEEGRLEKGGTMAELKVFLVENKDKGVQGKVTSFCGSSITHKEYTALENFFDENDLSFSDLDCDNIHIEDNHLVQLYVVNEELSSVARLSELIYLEDLRLIGAGIKDASALGNLENLQNLDLSSNEISDGEFLENLNDLRRLNLFENNLVDLSFREYLPHQNNGLPKKLEFLSVADNCISSDATFETLSANYAESGSWTGNPRDDC